MPLAERGVVFRNGLVPPEPHPNRADIACFVGFVSLRGGVPVGIERQLELTGWWSGPNARVSARDLLDVPVTVTSWEQFDAVFAWDERKVLHSDARTATWLGAAVRSFFAEGGRQCVIVRVGDPWPYGEWFNKAREETFRERIDRLIPGYPFALDTSASHPASWRGVSHLAGLPETSFVALPDLSELAAAEPDEPLVVIPEDNIDEQWAECSEAAVTITPSNLRHYPGPRSDQAGYERWARALAMLIRYLARYRRDMQALAAVPRPIDSEPLSNVFRYLSLESGVLAASPDLQSDGIASPFLQLAYPWLGTRAGLDLPGAAEPPEGVLAGQLAANALINGTFRSAVKIVPATVVELKPALTRQDQLELEGSHCFQDRVSLYARTPAGIRLRSDVTTALNAGHRSAAVNRLIGVLRRAAAIAGDEIAFENSGPELWEAIEDRLDGLMMRFWDEGALGGNYAAEAFSVRCDRTTMSQNDIDNGRLIAEVRFMASYPVETIVVSLEVNSGGRHER